MIVIAMLILVTFTFWLGVERGRNQRIKSIESADRARRSRG